MRNRYVILGTLSAAFGLVAYLGRGKWLVDAFAADLTAGFLGALITVILVERTAVLLYLLMG